MRYTIYDGEHEYCDQVTHELDPDKVYYQEGKVRCIDEAYVLRTIMYLDGDDGMTEYDEDGRLFEHSGGDYRLYELHIVKEISKADLKILNKYGV